MRERLRAAMLCSLGGASLQGWHGGSGLVSFSHTRLGSAFASVMSTWEAEAATAATDRGIEGCR